MFYNISVFLVGFWFPPVTRTPFAGVWCTLRLNQFFRASQPNAQLADQHCQSKQSAIDEVDYDFSRYTAMKTINSILFYSGMH